MLITDDDGVNSESFFFATWTDLQPKTSEETWPEGWQQRHLLASGGGEGSTSPSISFKSQVHIWFRKQSHTMEPSQRFSWERDVWGMLFFCGKGQSSWWQKQYRKVTSAWFPSNWSRASGHSGHTEKLMLYQGRWTGFTEGWSRETPGAVVGSNSRAVRESGGLGSRVLRSSMCLSPCSDETLQNESPGNPISGMYGS